MFHLTEIQIFIDLQLSRIGKCRAVVTPWINKTHDKTWIKASISKTKTFAQIILKMHVSYPITLHISLIGIFYIALLHFTQMKLCLPLQGFISKFQRLSKQTT